jgi:hypothetical protein
LACDLAPLVVDRRERDRYLECLDRANEGDLRPLIRFLAELEIVALRSELERPVTAEQARAGRGALAVLDAGITRLRELSGAAGAQERAAKVAEQAGALHGKVDSWLRSMAARLESRLRDGIDPQPAPR